VNAFLIQMRKLRCLTYRGGARIERPQGVSSRITHQNGVKAVIDPWIVQAGLRGGPLFRAIGKTGTVCGDGFTSKVIWSIVKQTAADFGMEDIAPHNPVGPVLDSVIRLAGSWSKSSSSLGLYRSKR
jgi:hypothetical protein